MADEKETKAFNVRFPRYLWSFLRKHSVDIELSMNQIIVACMESYKKRTEKNINKNENKQLTDTNIMIP